jgi:hypothetical protein
MVQITILLNSFLGKFAQLFTGGQIFLHKADNTVSEDLFIKFKNIKNGF